ncbi:expressed unknown protein [Seminavis robusta]|uniref:Uncharacterized protein n=1 Tax=Seminavis robusta TaxID=568900 RepID=A0A9N8HAD2_9STRA|nr:expressed unknown protein [Seminavis robusta]|eukprot:Sro291_g109510.1 n/a (75) ;mRNA; f:55626-56125
MKNKESCFYKENHNCSSNAIITELLEGGKSNFLNRKTDLLTLTVEFRMQVKANEECDACVSYWLLDMVLCDGGQ